MRVSLELVRKEIRNTERYQYKTRMVVYKMRNRLKRFAGFIILAMILQMLTPVTAVFSEAAAKPKLSAKSIVLTQGQKRKLKVKKAAKRAKIKWKSKNKRIAKVSKKGVVKAIRKGTTKIRCTYRKNRTKKVLTCKVRVVSRVKPKPTKAPKPKPTVSSEGTPPPTRTPDGGQTPSPTARIHNTLPPTSTAGISDTPLPTDDPVTALTAKITILSDFWESFLEVISFGIIHNDEQEVRITAESSADIADIGYYITDRDVDLDQAKTLPYTAYDDNDRPILQKGSHNIVYAKVTDNNNAVIYIRSDGIVINEGGTINSPTPALSPTPAASPTPVLTPEPTELPDNAYILDLSQVQSVYGNESGFAVSAGKVEVTGQQQGLAFDLPHTLAAGKRLAVTVEGTIPGGPGLRMYLAKKEDSMIQEEEATFGTSLPHTWISTAKESCTRIHIKGARGVTITKGVIITKVIIAYLDEAAVTEPPAAVTTPPAAATTPPAKATTPPVTVTTPPAAVTTPPAGETSEPVITKNPVALQEDFEDGEHPFTGRDTAEILTVQNGGYEDSKSLLISGRAKAWHGASVDMLDRMEPYQAYTVEAYVKHTVSGDKSIKCMFDYIDTNGVQTYPTVAKVKVPQNNWVKISATVTAPGDASALSMYFEMENYTNDFIIDNITVQRKFMDKEAVLAVGSLQEAFGSKFDMGVAVSIPHLKNPDIADFIKHHYRTITFGNEMKPDTILLETPSIEAEDGMPVINETMLDQCMTLAEQNDLKVRYHTLLWHSQTPNWFFCEDYKVEYDGSGTALTNITNLVNKETMLARIRSYITKVVTYLETNYPGAIYAYDVVNEVVEGGRLRTIADKSLYGAIFNAGTEVSDLVGETTYITEAFKAAKEAAIACGSSAKMFYNDYNGYSSGARRAIVAALADSKTGGYVDGIGMQSHLTNLGGSDSDNIKNSLNHFTSNGYEVQITELDIHNKDNSAEGNKVLAARYKMLFEQVLGLMNTNSLNLTNVTFWGLTDFDTWLTEQKGETSYPLLFDGDYLPKAAYYAVMETAPEAPPATPPPVTTPLVTPPSVTVQPGETPPANETPPPPGTGVLSIADGSIEINAIGYKINNGPQIPYTGDYIINGGGISSANAIKVNGGSHNIEIRDLVINEPSGANPIQLIGGAEVNLTVTGQNSLLSKQYFAGIEVIKGTTLTVSGTGELKVTGGTGSAGIGASGNDSDSYTSTLGTIIVDSGTIIANGGRNGAGIGDSRVGKGGTIVINGGNIFAKSQGNAAGIGGGGSDWRTAGEYEGLYITVNGGIMSLGGSSADIGWGKGASDASVKNYSRLEVYGGSIHYANNKGKGAFEEPTKDTYTGIKIDIKSLNLQTVDAVYVDDADQHIQGFHSDANGKASNTIALQLFMTKDVPHTVRIVSGGTTYTYSVSNNTAVFVP